jgi:prolyl oligopeptidase
MDDSKRLRELCYEYWEASLRNNPTWATYLGDFRYNDRLADLSDAGRARRQAEAEGFLARLKEIPPGGLGEGERVTADILRLQLELSIEENRHKLWQWAVEPLSGPQADFPQIMNYHPLDDEAGLTARFRAFPAFIDQYLDNLRAGVREGRTAMRPAVERVIGQTRGLLAVAPEASPFGARPAFVPAAHEAVYPALRKLLEYLEREYLPRSRARDVGIWALPGGSEAYRFLIRHHLSVDVTPEEVHRVGMEELAKIHGEMRRIAGGDVRAFSERMKKDPQCFYSTGDEILEGARRELDRASAALPKVFRRLPRAGCEVKAIEAYRAKDAPGAYYYPPDEKLTRKGIFYANTHEPGTRPRFTMPALAFHEAVPGHHLQIALAMELEDLPKFRRHAGFTAFVEGWALYAERLADEMGLYEDDRARFGMLTYQAWRAARLVVDTGLHALR